MIKRTPIVIKDKLCKCGCGGSGRIFSKGLLKSCWMREYGKPIARQSLKVKVISEKDESGAELQRWFEDRHKELTGRCKNCGGKTQKGQPNYKCSIAHILPKAYFKSVATHPDNWLELCFYGVNSCHTQMDNKMLDLIDMNCFEEIITKFVAIYPHITQHEKRRIPQVLLNYIEVEK